MGQPNSTKNSNGFQITKKEFEENYKKPKFSDQALARAEKLGLKITYN
jgi:hypothetical protein